MDGVMDAWGGEGKGEDESADLKGKRSSFPAELNLVAWLRHTALPVFIPSAQLWLLTSFNQPTNQPKASEPCNPPVRSFSLILSLSFSLTSWLTPLFPLFIFLTLIHYLLPLALFPHSFNFSYLLSLFLSVCSSPDAPFLQPSGSTEGCGIRPGPPGFHSDTLCPDVISIDGVQLGQAVLAQGMFTVYPNLNHSL